MPRHDRARALTRARLAALPVFGATDMHGLGRTPTAWNVVRLTGWRALSDSTLQRTLLAHLRAGGADVNRVIVLDRWVSPGLDWGWAAAPLGLWGALRRASPAHGASLVGWIWVVALLLSRRTRR